MNEELDIEQKTGFSITREIFDWAESAITALLGVILIYVFVGMVITVDGQSMERTLHDSDRLVISKLYAMPKYRDIVVVVNPNLKNNPLIKRVIATEGQTIDFNIDKGEVVVDGKVLDEPYIAEKMHWLENNDYPMTIPKGHVFVMGDNRNHSWDSRVPEVGSVDARYILGKVVYRYLPFEDLGVPDDKYK